MLKLRILLVTSLALAPALALAQTDSHVLQHRRQVQDIGSYEADFVTTGSDPTLFVIRLLEQQLLAIPGVTGVHDMHVSITNSGFDAVSAHVVVADMAAAKRILTEARRIMVKEFDVEHVAIQIENEALRAEEEPQGV